MINFFFCDTRLERSTQEKLEEIDQRLQEALDNLQRRRGQRE